MLLDIHHGADNICIKPGEYRAPAPCIARDSFPTLDLDSMLLIGLFTLVVASTGWVIAAKDTVDSQTCINQYSGSIFVDFDNIDVAAGSSFKVKIGSINTGNLASSYASSGTVVVDQQSGDIFLNFEGIDVEKGGKFGIDIGHVNTGNLAVIGHHHKPSK